MKLIKGKKEENNKKIEEKKKFLNNKYEQLFYKSCINLDIEKACFYGVKYVGKFDIYKINDIDELYKLFKNITIIVDFLGLLTFEKFINIFPIEKDYSGYKFDCKDFWSTKEYLDNFDLKNFIGDEALMLMMNYYNFDIISFSVKQTLVLDRIRRAEGKLSLMDEFLNQVDPEGKIHTYSYYEEEGFLLDRDTGKTIKVSKPKKKKPAHLKVVK